MNELITNMALGFETAFSLKALCFCFIGVTVGTLVGVLPGIGPLAAISLALPLTYYIDPTTALIMLAGIFYGAQYGGRVSSILLNLPGEATTAILCQDGYPLTRQGRALMALFVTAIVSFVGASIAIILLMGFAPLIAELALKFSSVEYFSVMLLGMVAASTLSVGSPIKGLAMVILGVALGMVGTDVSSGLMRYTFGVYELSDGFGLEAVAMGLFGVAEIIGSIGVARPAMFKLGKLRFRDMLPTREETKKAVMPTLRGSFLGSFIGAMPGTGPGMATLMAYAMEKRVSKTPEKFGTGELAGIAAPEAAGNASIQAAFIPTLSLGIPGDAVIAVLMGAMIIHGITPGPNLINDQPQMFWGLIASFWVGNLLLLVLNIPMIGLWVRLLSVRYDLLYPVILLLICVGVYAADNSAFNVFLVLIFGLIGHVMRIFKFPATPLLLGFILGPMMEEHFRRALLLARGHLTVFVERPISLTFLLLTLLFILISFLPLLRKKKAP